MGRPARALSSAAIVSVYSRRRGCFEQRSSGTASPHDSLFSSAVALCFCIEYFCQRLNGAAGYGGAVIVAAGPPQPSDCGAIHAARQHDELVDGAQRRSLLASRYCLDPIATIFRLARAYLSALLHSINSPNRQTLALGPGCSTATCQRRPPTKTSHNRNVIVTGSDDLALSPASSQRTAT